MVAMYVGYHCLTVRTFINTCCTIISVIRHPAAWHTRLPINTVERKMETRNKEKNMPEMSLDHSVRTAFGHLAQYFYGGPTHTVVDSHCITGPTVRYMPYGIRVL